MKLTARIAATALAISMVIGAGAAGAGAAAGGTGARPAAPAVPKYYMALPGGDNFANVPGSATAVVGDTFTGKRLLTVRASGKDKFVTVSAAADDRTFVLGAEPDPKPPAIPMATAWYLVHVTPGARFRATVAKLRIPAPAKDDEVDATALSPDGRELAMTGLHDVQPNPTQWVRIYSVATGALLHSWSGLRDVSSGGYTTLYWTGGGHQLAIGLEFPVTPAGSTRSWPYLGVRLLDVRSPGHDLTADSRIAWRLLAATAGLSKPVPLTCAVDLRVVVSANGTVVCAGYGLLRVYKANPFGPECPAVPPWNSEGFIAYSTVTGKLAGTLFRKDTNCLQGDTDVLWTSAGGDTVIGYYSLGGFLAKKPIFRFGIFSHGTYTPLPVPLTTTTIPVTIAW